MKKFLSLLFIVSLLIPFTSCGQYTTEGVVTGKYEKNGQYYVQFNFIDKNGKTLDFENVMAKDSYDAYSVGDITPVNVNDDASGFLWVMLGGGVLLLFMLITNLAKKKKQKVPTFKTIREIMEEEKYDEIDEIDDTESVNKDDDYLSSKQIY